LSGSKSLPFFDYVLNEFTTAAKSLLEVCSRTGEFRMSNYSLAKSELTAKYPPGEYRADVKFYDDIDDSIYNLTLFVLNFR
jgi:hypothetical protein